MVADISNIRRKVVFTESAGSDSPVCVEVFSAGRGLEFLHSPTPALLV